MLPSSPFFPSFPALSLTPRTAPRSTEDSFLSAPPVLAALASLPPSVPTQTYDDARGTVHGYGSRPDLARTEVREAFAIGLERTAEWFRAHL